MRGTWQTTDSGGGGGGLGIAVLVIIAAALVGPAVATAATAVAAAVAELVHIVLITVAVLLGLGAVGVAALVGVRVWRWHNAHSLPRTDPAPPPWRATVTTLERQVADEAPLAIEATRQVHLHFHGVQAEDVAELVRSQQQDEGQGCPPAQTPARDRPRMGHERSQ
jgi:hypothetical protein